MLLIYNFESKQNCKSLAHIFLITLLETCRHVMNSQEQHRPPPCLTFANIRLALLICWWLAGGCPCAPLLFWWLLVPQRQPAAHSCQSSPWLCTDHPALRSQDDPFTSLLTSGWAVLINKTYSVVQQFLVSLEAQNVFLKKGNIYTNGTLSLLFFLSHVLRWATNLGLFPPEFSNVVSFLH